MTIGLNARPHPDGSWPTTPVPPAAAWLGGFGAIPFVALDPGQAILGPDIGAVVNSALTVYGAVILSFLGGIHWGLAIAPGRDVRAGWLVISVLPSLGAWVALLLPAVVQLPLLALGFAVMLAVDLAAVRRGQAPAWYPRLRWPLSVVVITCLAVGSLV